MTRILPPVASEVVHRHFKLQRHKYFCSLIPTDLHRRSIDRFNLKVLHVLQEVSTVLMASLVTTVLDQSTSHELGTLHPETSATIPTVIDNVKACRDSLGRNIQYFLSTIHQ